MLRTFFKRDLKARYKGTTRTNDTVLIPILPVIRANNLSFVLKCGQ